jgi:hypothetical protein
VVNKLVKEYGSLYKYIFTFDSDIKFDIKEPNVLERCYNIAEQIENFGLISLNQKDYNCQLYAEYRNEKEINGEKLKWSNNGSGTAGGCLFMSTKSFLDIGGYRVIGPYAGEDAYLMLDLTGKDYMVATAETINCIHPRSQELKKGYNQFKTRNCELTHGGSTAFYDQNYKITEEFWNQ